MRFFSLVALSFVGTAALFFATVQYQVGKPRDDTSWAAEVAAKKAAGVRLVPGPRILIFGGSNALYGISAEQMTEKLGVETFNMATWAAFDLDYIVHLVRRHARPGDTVLLSLEYHYYRVDQNMNANMISFFTSADPQYYYSLPLRTRLKLAFALPPMSWYLGLKAAILGPKAMGRYEAEAVNTLGARGDFGASDEDRWDAATRASMEHSREIMEANPESGGLRSDPEQFNRLTDLVDWAKASKIRVIATWPVRLWDAGYEKQGNSTLFEEIEGYYRKHHIPLLATWRQAMFNRKDLAGSPNHLTARARTVWTSVLIDAYRASGLDKSP